MPRKLLLETTAEAYFPSRLSLTALRNASKDCKACDLYKRGTQTVFGEGPAPVQLLFVGEQPGDEEDLQGRPFVGPAGRLLEKALLEAGIPRTETYVTNVVKHFKWVPRGKRRIHDKPNIAEITACIPWLLAEITLVKPQLVVCLGATAAQALLGKKFRVTQQRGEILSSSVADKIMATVHPSSILRAPDDEARRTEMRRFIQDLQKAARKVGL